LSDGFIIFLFNFGAMYRPPQLYTAANCSVNLWLIKFRQTFCEYFVSKFESKNFIIEIIR
jgi:hypothetical protein